MLPAAPVGGHRVNDSRITSYCIMCAYNHALFVCSQCVLSACQLIFTVLGEGAHKLRSQSVGQVSR